jgi:hypothetical protein
MRITLLTEPAMSLSLSFPPREGVGLVPSASSRVRPLGTGRKRGTTERACVGPEPRAVQRAWRGPARCPDRAFGSRRNNTRKGGDGMSRGWNLISPAIAMCRAPSTLQPGRSIDFAGHATSTHTLNVRTLVSSAQPGESRTANTLVCPSMNLRRLPQGWRRDGKLRNNLSD